MAVVNRSEVSRLAGICWVLISQLCYRRIQKRSATVVRDFTKEEPLSCLNSHHLHSFNCIMSRRARWKQKERKKKKCLTKPNAENQIKISEEKGLHNRISRQISFAMELLMRFCSVDANVWLTWPWVNQNLRDAAVRDKSLSLPLNVELMIHTWNTSNAALLPWICAVAI